MGSRLRGSKGRGRRPRAAPTPWVPAFAGMTKLGGRNDEVRGRNGEGEWGEGVVVEGIGVGIAGGRLASRPYQMGCRWNRGAPPSQSSPIEGEEVRG